MKILLDTNILVRAAVTPDGLAGKIVQAIRQDERHVLVVSRWVLGEVADVLRGPRIQAKWRLSDGEIYEYCQLLEAAGEHASAVQLPAVIADPKDQPIIEAAVAARVDVICTSDMHFEAESVRDYLARFGITVMTDRELLVALS